MQDYGIYLFGEDYKNISPNTKFKLLKKHGFSSVSIRWSEDYSITTPIERLKAALKAGLKIENIHLPYIGVKFLWEEKSEQSKKYLQELFNALKICKQYDIKKAVIHVSYTNNMPEVNEEAIKNFKALSIKAKECGVMLAFENTRLIKHLRYVLNGLEKYKYLNDTVKLCYDTGHANCFTPKNDVLSEFGDKLIDLHIHDNIGVTDQHLLPFEGNFDFKKFCKQLKQLNYNGSLFLEVITDAKTEAELEQFIIKAKKAEEKLMKLYNNAKA